MKTITTPLFIAITLFFYLPFPTYGRTLGIIGDSVATGALSDSSINATIPSLIKNAVTRGLKNTDETQWGINFPENSFGYIIGSLLGSRSIVSAASNGKRIHTIYEQFLKLNSNHQNNPDDFIISYTANDACGMDVFEQSKTEFRSIYKNNLLNGTGEKGGLLKMLAELKGKKERKVIVLAPLNFNQILSNPMILSHEIPSTALRTATCLRFRTGHYTYDSPGIVAKKLPQLCKAILTTDPLSNHPDMVYRRNHLNDIYAAMIEAQQDAIAVAQANIPSNVKLIYATSPRSLQFEGKHIANDCFHLSAQGQGLLALTAWKEISTQLMP